MATIQPLNATIATPAANGFAYLLDSTRWGQSIAGTLQPSTCLSSPGTDTGWMTMRQIVGSINPVGQAVTLKFYILSAGAWVHQTALDVTAPAGQPTAIEFSPAAYGSADGMVAMQAGNTPPTSISGSATISDVSSESIADTLLTTVGDTLVKTAAGFARLPAPAVGSVKTGNTQDPNGQVDLVLNQDNVPSGTTAKQYNPAAVNETGGTSKDVVHSDTVTAGEAISAGYGVGVKDATGPKWYRSSGASATALLCGGIATAAASGSGQPLSVQSVGVTGVIPDAAWDTLPTTAQVGSVVYASRTILGGFTLDVSAFTTADVKQPIGILSQGGTGACKIHLMIQALLGLTTSVRDVAVTDLVFAPAYLTGATDATSVVATWQAVTAGSFAITIDGTARTISALNFSTDTTMALVASRIQAAIRVVTGALETCAWSTDHFLISSVSTANTSAVTVTSATGSGTDISGAAGGSRFLSCNSTKGVVTARAHGVYTLAVSDQRLRILCTATDPVWLLLPTCASVGNAKQYVFVDVGYLSGTNAITIVHNGAQTIANVAADITLASNGGEVILTCDLAHTNWTKNVGSAAQLATSQIVLAARTINAQAGNTYSFALTDTYEAGCALVTFSYATAVTVTVPRNDSIALPVGCTINCQQVGAGKVTFAAQDGTVTINPVATLSISAQWGAASLAQTAANVWSLIGSLSA
jgi:hypothetical protein